MLALKNKLIFSLKLMCLAALIFVAAAKASAQTGFSDPNIDYTVHEILLLPDGKILISGDFNNVGGQPRSKVARLNSDGTLDASFQTPDIAGLGTNDDVFALGRQPDGKILIGGYFTSVGGVARNALARLNADGSLDASFAPSVNGTVTEIALQPDGKIVIAGYFTSVGGQTRNRLARLNQDGSLDASFQDPNINDSISVVGLQSLGRILIGGRFTSVGGQSRANLARLFSDGSLDASFNPAIDGEISDFDFQPDGKILIAGFLKTVNGVERTRVARLNADGTLDQTFQNPNIAAGSFLRTVAAQADGKVIIGGEFSNINGTERRNLARLNSDGTLDSTFSDINANYRGDFSSVHSIVVQPDEKILIGGYFTTIGGRPRKMVVRLNRGGTLDLPPAQTFTVTKTEDTNDNVCNSDCSLREAVAAANANEEGGFITFAPDVFANGNTIVLTGGQLLIGANRRISIKGQGTGTNTVAISGNRASRIFEISRDAEMTIENLVLVQGTESGADGGAIYIAANGTTTSLALTNVGIHQCQALAGGGLYSAGSATVLINNSTFAANTATYNYGGGAIYFTSGTLTISNSAIYNNSATFSNGTGGGLNIGGGTVFNLINSTVNGNVARLIAGGIGNAGNTTITNSTISANRTETGSGGGIYSSNGVLRLNNSTISNNTAAGLSNSSGGGIVNYSSAILTNTTVNNNSAALGGGIFNQGVLEANGSTVVTNNALNGGGGGIYNNYNGGTSPSRVIMSNSIIGGNTSSSSGGGIYNRSLFVIGFSNVRDNFATNGGGGGAFNAFLGVGAPNLQISNSTFSGNRTNGTGGAILNQAGIVVLGNSTLSGNMARGVGGAINTNNSGANGNNNFINLINATIAFNSSNTGAGGISNSGSTVNARNTIIARNTGGNSPGFNDFAGTLTSEGYNLLGTTTNTTITGTTTGNLLNVDPMLAPLADNGGLTATHALRPSSPAIDAAASVNEVNADQRGLPRPFDFPAITNAQGGNASDIGAFERQSDDRAIRSKAFDFDGDGRADISVFRTNTWYVQGSQAGFTAMQWGAVGDVIVPADYDGDGKTDFAVFRPATGFWYISNSSNNQFTAIYFGKAGDLPRPTDFDGDGRADIVVFRPSDGTWYRQNSSNNQFSAVQFGTNGDVPVIADFDGDNKPDLTVFRQGYWYYLTSSDNQFKAVQFGTTGDKPAVGDFDGDGKTDISVFRPSNGYWYRRNSSNNLYVPLPFGNAEDIPTPADYDGDGKTDVSVFRPSTGGWYRINSATNAFYGEQFGVSADQPAPAAFNQ
ncbi:MAG TPA: choice-of-anchor Q domain-containing protein [Pyrinomonadaceae bacterium]